MASPDPSAPSFRLAHLSDIHFGKIAHERVVPALVEEVNAHDLDLVVISGDLTQRARTAEFEAARRMIDAFDAPTLVVPGNHDVRAWWHNPFERIFRSASRFREFIGDETTPHFVKDGLAVFGLNSAHGLTIKGGKIRPRHLDRMRTFFEAPVIVVPGNHDVRAWWHNPFERVFRSASRFRKFIGDETTPQFVRDGLAAFGLNSAHGLTIKGGKIRPRHLERMRTFFDEQPADAFRVLVVHHHLTKLKALGKHDVAHGAKEALEVAGVCSVDLVLCGHLHVSHVEHIETDVERGHRLVIASAGTATSSRGRGDNRDVNFYNHICVWPDRFAVEERRFDPATATFRAERDTTFERVAEPV